MRCPIAVLLLVPVAAAEPTKEQIEEAAGKLQGQWRCYDGPLVLREAGEGLNFGNLDVDFRGDTCEFTTHNPTVPDPISLIRASARIRLDPTTSPARMDLALKWMGKGDKRLAIYKVDGDTLTICWGKTRPTKFKADDRDGGGSCLAVFKRIKR
jgi:uncharacterized protein (TIGR03067 family)